MHKKIAHFKKASYEVKAYIHASRTFIIAQNYKVGNRREG